MRSRYNSVAPSGWRFVRHAVGVRSCFFLQRRMVPHTFAPSTNVALHRVGHRFPFFSARWGAAGAIHACVNSTVSTQDGSTGNSFQDNSAKSGGKISDQANISMTYYSTWK